MQFLAMSTQLDFPHGSAVVFTPNNTRNCYRYGETCDSKTCPVKLAGHHIERGREDDYEIDQLLLRHEKVSVILDSMSLAHRQVIEELLEEVIAPVNRLLAQVMDPYPDPMPNLASGMAQLTQ